MDSTGVVGGFGFAMASLFDRNNNAEIICFRDLNWTGCHMNSEIFVAALVSAAPPQHA